MDEWQKNLDKITTSLWQDYEKALSSQAMMDLRDKIPNCIDFYEGRQWPSPTESTKNLPHPVVNVIKMICRSKKGAILSTPVKILYKSFSAHTDTSKFNSFASWLFKEMNQDELDRRGIDDSIKKGSCFFHYYWDKNARASYDGELGSVRCELIDPLNIFFSNPSELDEQKQDWIIIASRIDPRKITDSKAKTALSLTYGNENDEKITLLTRYFKINGEVYCEKATKHSVIQEPFKLINKEENRSDVQVDEKSFAFRPHLDELYPIACGYYERKEHSIYGMGEVEGLIPNQKAINFNIAMSLLNAQQCAWGKYIALPNALNGQKISNVPGQVLIDYSGTGDGIKKMPELELSKIPMDLVTTLNNLTRSVSGASQVMTGETFSNTLSGAAIAYLQAQAEVPIEELKNNFWYIKRKQGKIVCQFMKNYFYKRAFIKETSSKESDAEFELDEFYSSDYKNSLFDVIVEVVGGTKASVAADISLLDTCLQAGSISLETYIKSYPPSAITNKEEILKIIKQEKETELAKLKKENQILLEQLKKNKQSKEDT